MGCTASTLEHEQSVTRCKQRKDVIKRAVRHRHALAAAHAAYIQSLKNSGAAIRQFGDGDSKEAQVPKAPAAIMSRSMSMSAEANVSRFRPPVPPDLSDYLQPPPAISRAVSLPPIRNASSSDSPVRNPIVKEEEEEGEEAAANDAGENDDNRNAEEEEESENSVHNISSSYAPSDAKPPPPPNGWGYLGDHPETLMHAHASDHKSENQKINNAQPTSKDTTDHKPSISPVQKFAQILRELDDCFLDAFEKGKIVAGLLEARQIHYHSNFAGYSDSLDHSSRVLRVMSWGRDAQLPPIDGERTGLSKDVGKETHASILDKLLAWERKLHDEVKAGETIRIELERKAAQLKNQKKRDENSATINKTKAMLKSLHTRYLVEFQAVNAASSEVDKLRDNHLHKQLVKLVDELLKMWKHMLECHKKQYKMIEDMGYLNDESLAPAASNDFHFRNTQQLESEIYLWHRNLEKLILTQKDYVGSLYDWLRLHIIQIESDGKDTPSSPREMTTPAVYTLCKKWQAKLEELPGSVTLKSLNTFLNIVTELKEVQVEERTQKRKLDDLRKDLERKEQFLRMQEMKYNDRRQTHAQQNVVEAAGTQETGNSLKDRERMLRMLRDSVESESIKYESMCKRTGNMALNCLQKALPPALKAIVDFADASFKCYSDLQHEIMQEDPIPRIGYRHY